MPTSYAPLAATLDREVAWFTRVVEDRLRRYADGRGSGAEPDIAPPELTDPCAYGAAVSHNQLSRGERLVLILALLPWVCPQALDPLLMRNASIDRPFTEFGGTATPARAFVPTRQTALFLIAGDDLVVRTRSIAMFSVEGPLVRNRLLAQQADDYAPWMPLDPHPELIERLFRVPD
ncbi:hypothetical protein [Sphingomonas koreensis]